MTNHRALCRPIADRPARTFRIARPARVKADSGDYEENVTFAGIHADPFAFSRVAVAPKPFRRHRAPQHARRLQDIRRRAGAIVGGIDAPSMTAAVGIRQAGDAIPGRDGRLHRGRRRRRSNRVTITQQRGSSGDVAIGIGRTGATAEEGEREEGSEAKHRRTLRKTRASGSLSRRQNCAIVAALRMPLVSSSFAPPWFLSNGHVQTILPVLFPRSFPEHYERERLELPDGDFLDLDWIRHVRPRLAILSHGLEGHSRQGYIRGLTKALVAAGWDVLAWSFRGCSGEPNRLLRFYHSGETSDLRAVVQHAAKRYARIAVIGFSLGGNVVLKYLGESPPLPQVVAGAALSVPIDLGSCARKLDRQWSNRIYLRRFLATMIPKITEKARRFPGQIDTAGLHSVGSFLEFDGRFTAKIHGFRDADDYWLRSSARQFLPGITAPTLLINARNDPFLTPACFPIEEAEEHTHFHFESPASGGHVGFLDLRNGLQPWWEQRVTGFLNAADH